MKTASQNNDLNQLNDNESSTVKVKLPSWTDRILYKSLNAKITLIQYSCINTITISDHKPVYALFDVEIKKIDENKYNKIYDNLLKEADKRSNEEMPHILIDKYEFDFDDCMFYDQKVFAFNVTNKGLTRTTVVVLFHEPESLLTEREIVYNTDTADIDFKSYYAHKPHQWVAINPQHKEKIQPSQTFKIEVTTCFNNQHILKKLNRNRQVQDFLIVRCLNGNDIFFTIKCNYKPTIIGFSLKALSTLSTQENTFDKCDIVNLMDAVELEVHNFESNLNIIWLTTMKNLSTEIELFGADKMPVVANKTSKKVVKSQFYDQAIVDPSLNLAKIQTYKQCFAILKHEIVKEDKYFLNELPAEYEFFMQHLIDRCQKNLDTLSENTSGDTTNVSNSSFKIEDQKNLILKHLSDKDWEKFHKENFDMELLVEVLLDLLYMLPGSLIPNRYIEYFVYLGDDYDDYAFILEFLPKSHCRLFQMLVKFLQIYLRCLSSCDSNLNSMIANAIFKINQSNAECNILGESLEANAINKLLAINNNQVAVKFLKIFITN